MDFKSIWQKIVSLKDNFVRRADWSSKNKDIINRFHETARRSTDKATHVPSVQDAPDRPSRNTEKPNAAIYKPVKKEAGVPARLTDMLGATQRHTVEGALSQQAKVKDLYAVAGLQNTARRFFQDPRISSVLTTGIVQFNHDIRFVSDENMDSLETALPEIGGSQKALYHVLSAEFINAADPHGKPMRVTSLQGHLRSQGVIVGEPIARGFEAALKEYGDSLKDPSSKVVPLRKPRNPDGMK